MRGKPVGYEPVFSYRWTANAREVAGGGDVEFEIGRTPADPPSSGRPWLASLTFSPASHMLSRADVRSLAETILACLDRWDELGRAEVEWTASSPDNGCELT